MDPTQSLSGSTPHIRGLAYETSMSGPELFIPSENVIINIASGKCRFSDKPFNVVQWPFEPPTYIAPLTETAVPPECVAKIVNFAKSSNVLYEKREVALKAIRENDEAQANLQAEIKKLGEEINVKLISNKQTP